jgi:hypothetical protein
MNEQTNLQRMAERMLNPLFSVQFLECQSQELSRNYCDSDENGRIVDWIIDVEVVSVGPLRRSLNPVLHGAERQIMSGANCPNMWG